MVQLSITDANLTVRIDGLDRLWALRRRLVIPLANVRGATADPGIIKGWKGFRSPGTWIPGVLVAGTFHIDGERVFWDVHDPAKAIVIELAHERYARLVLQVGDPRAAVALVEQATRAH